MPPERGPAPMEIEGRKPHHPEFFSPYLERTVEVIDGWKSEHESLGSTPDEELRLWKEDFALLEEEHTSGQRVTFDGMHALVDRIDEIAAHSSDQNLQQLNVRVHNLESRVRSSVQEYLKAVKYHSRQSRTAHLQENGDQILHAISGRRSETHDLLIDVLDAFRQAVNDHVLKKQATSFFQPGELDQLIDNATFSKLELSKKGLAREKIGEWSLIESTTYKGST
jgi:hypothetical protein